MKEKDIYIKILEYGEQYKSGFDFEDIKKGLDTLESWETQIIQQFMDAAHYNQGSVGAPGYSEKETIFFCIKREFERYKSKYIINLDSRFKYLDYLELQEARRASRQALITAIIAIGFTAIALFVSIYFSYKELNSPIKVNEQQFQEIKNLIKNNN